VKTGIHKSVVIPISYLDSCLRRNDIFEPYHGKIYSKQLFGSMKAREAWERIWGTAEHPVRKEDYPENWKIWEEEILMPFIYKKR